MTPSLQDELKHSIKELREINWISNAWKALKQLILRQEMRKAAEAMDRLRSSSKSQRWSGANEIRKWRDATKSP